MRWRKGKEGGGGRAAVAVADKKACREYIGDRGEVVHDEVSWREGKGAHV